MSDRLAAARDYVRRKPTDRFGLYALAMELRKGQLWDECFPAFLVLLQHHPDWATGWYHYAMARRESGDRAGCEGALRDGLGAATRSGDAHAKSEIQSALDGMEDEE